MNTQLFSNFDIRSFGALAAAVPVSEVTCPARIHAGWKPAANLRSTIYGPKEAHLARTDGEALQAAIDAAASHGGGEVTVPAGDYLIGPTRLYSNVTLSLASGAMLYATTDLEAYAFGDSPHSDIASGPPRKGGGEGVTLGGNVLLAENARNICLRGPGGISGQGGVWLLPWWQAEKSYVLRRPSKMILFKNCQGIRIENFIIKDSPNWTLVFQNCQDIEINGLTIDNQHGPNVDGIDIVDSRNVRIQKSRISTTDDGICLKSFDPEGVVENIHVSECEIRTMCNGFKIGSETVGTFRNIHAEGIRFYNNDWDPVDMISAIGVSATDGGRIDNVVIRNVTASHARAAFHVSVGARRLFQEKFRSVRPGRIHNVTIDGLSVAGVCHASLVSGMAESPISEFSLRNCRVKSAVIKDGAEKVPVAPEEYPDPTMFGELPAYGVYLRHVEGLSMEQCEWGPAEGEKRPPVILDEVTG